MSWAITCQHEKRAPAHTHVYSGSRVYVGNSQFNNWTPIDSFLPRDAYAQRGLRCRKMSVCLSVTRR